MKATKSLSRRDRDSKPGLPEYKVLIAWLWHSVTAMCVSLKTKHYSGVDFVHNLYSL